MFRTRIPTTLFVLLLGGCSLLGEHDPSSHRRVVDVPVLSADVLGTSRRSVSFDFKGRLDVPCYAFEEVVVDRDGRTLKLKMRARSTSNVCITILGTLHVAPLVIGVPKPGTYTFEFWRGRESDPLKVTVDVP